MQPLKSGLRSAEVCRSSRHRGPNTCTECDFLNCDRGPSKAHLTAVTGDHVAAAFYDKVAVVSARDVATCSSQPETESNIKKQKIKQ